MAGTDDAGEPAARKVQRTGGSTFTVSLPKEWATGQDLAAGSTVYLYPFEDRVVVAPARREAEERRVTLDVAGLDMAAIARDVRRAYAAGFDTITVECAEGDLSDSRRSAIADSLTGLVGMQIVAEGAEGIEAHSTLDASAVSLDQTLAQVRQGTLSALREAVRALSADDGEAARQTEDRVTEVDRLVALVERQFQGALVDVREVDQLDGNRSGAYRQVSVADALGAAAAAAETVSAVAAEQSSPPGADVDAAFVAAGDALREAIRTVLADDRRSAADAVGDARERVQAIETALAETDDPDAHLYGLAVAALSRGSDAAGDLASLRLGDAEL